MPLLSAHRVAKHFGSRTLFSDVSFDVEEKSRIGLVGANGCGKTTLFHILTGELPPDEGQVVKLKDTRIGYMQQHITDSNTRTLFDEVQSVFSPLIEAEAALTAVNEQLRDPRFAGDAALIERQTALREQLERDGGLYYQSRVRATLLGLGFEEADLGRPMSTFSGGQRSKAAMARLLLSDSNLLLLDEPTNHLDVRAVEWLEQFLIDYRGAFVVISHDRYFLDRVTERTMELVHGRLFVTAGGYSVHRERREKAHKVEQKQYETAQREIKRIEDNITLLKQWNREKSIRAAESREKRVERLKAELIVPEAALEAIRFDFTAAETSGSEVVEAGALEKSFDKPLFSHVDLHIRRGERVFLYGANGCGKTTLLKILNGLLPPDRGFVRLGAKVSVGYYDQTQSNLSPEKMAIDELWDAYPQMTQTQIRSAMAAFLFRGDDVFKQVSLLSGGEKARLLLLKLMLGRHNLLLLDEPTNHLDIASCEALEQALAGYDGTLLVVSHDRYFINRMATRMLWLTPDGVQSITGNYDALYERMQACQQAAEPPEKPKETANRQSREQVMQRRRLTAELRQVEREIEQTETAIRAANEQLADEQTASDYTQVLRLGEEVAQRERQLELLMTRWEQLQQSAEE